MKSKVCGIHYLLRRILFPRNINLKIVIRNDIVPLCLITQQFQTNWIEGILLEMYYCKQTHSIRIPYGALIAKLLGSFEIDIREKQRSHQLTRSITLH